MLKKIQLGLPLPTQCCISSFALTFEDALIANEAIGYLLPNAMLTQCVRQTNTGSIRQLLLEKFAMRPRRPRNTSGSFAGQFVSIGCV